MRADACNPTHMTKRPKSDQRLEPYVKVLENKLKRDSHAEGRQTIFFIPSHTPLDQVHGLHVSTGTLATAN